MRSGSYIKIFAKLFVNGGNANNSLDNVENYNVDDVFCVPF